MKLFGFEIRRQEKREGPISRENFFESMGWADGNAPSVSVDSALTVPAVSAAVTFLSSSMANLPLHAYQKTKESSKRAGGVIQRILNEAPNEGWSSFAWRKYMWQQVFTGGRGLSYIERNSSGAISAIYPLNPKETVIKRLRGKIVYEHGKNIYSSSEIIDIPFMLKADQISHYSPIMNGKKAISLALAMSDYASNFFIGGGVPPLALSGPLPQGAEALKRAMSDVARAVKAAKDSKSAMFAMPPDHKLTPVGFDPAKGQMTEARRLQIEEIARLYNLPPVFLQDLTNGTYSNTEQQDLHLVKHLIAQWASAFENELNLKLFGAKNNNKYVEHNLDGLQRGDFSSRMAGLSSSIQNAILTPNEARALDNRAAKVGGDDLFIQGATVPIVNQKTGDSKDG